MPEAQPRTQASKPDTRSRVVAAAADLIAAGGSDAATTRAVAAAADVQPPTIYRLFGDKDGLLDAVAEDTLATYVAEKTGSEQSDDPVADLRRSWDTHVAFGVDHPEVFALMHTPGREQPSPAQAAGRAFLHEAVRRIARAGQLRIDEDRAVDLLNAGVAGAVLTLLQKAPEDRDGLSSTMRDAVLAALLGAQSVRPDAGAQGAASALHSRLEEVPELTPGERHLLGELLQRIARPPVT
jgi:AcrR family transcriptional regulator